MMLEELQRRNYSPDTIRCYLRAVADFARYFHRSPDQLRPEHVREYQAYLFRERKLNGSSVTQQLAALRFFFLKTLKKRWTMDEPRISQRVTFSFGTIRREYVLSAWRFIGTSPRLG